MNFPIYLDNHSTTRLDDRVLEAMLPYLKDNYGNPSSKGHSLGWIAEEAVSNARSLIAKAINASANEIIFTSGTTESNNLAIKGIAGAYSKKKNHLITSAVEHPSVLEVFQLLRNSGFTVSILPVNKYGIIDLNKLRETISEKTLLVSIMMANNEIGTISPITEIAGICHERSVLFHTDAAQAIGKIDVDVRKINADMISFSAHKNYGPKGIGALYLKKKFPSISLIPQINGGGQERNIRSGTLNVPAIVGFGKAMEITSEALQDENRIIKNLRDKLQMELFSKLDGIYLNGHPEKRLPNNLNISLEGVNIDLLLLELNDLALSTGSACASASPEPSHVLQEIGLNNTLLKSSLRFGLGRFNSKEEIEFTSQRVISAVKKIRGQNI